MKTYRAALIGSLLADEEGREFTRRMLSPAERCPAQLQKSRGWLHTGKRKSLYVPLPERSFFQTRHWSTFDSLSRFPCLLRSVA